jgi:hypothetical protein
MGRMDGKIHFVQTSFNICNDGMSNFGLNSSGLSWFVVDNRKNRQNCPVYLEDGFRAKSSARPFAPTEDPILRVPSV